MFSIAGADTIYFKPLWSSVTHEGQGMLPRKQLPTRTKRNRAVAAQSAERFNGRHEQLARRYLNVGACNTVRRTGTYVVPLAFVPRGESGIRQFHPQRYRSCQTQMLDSATILTTPSAYSNFGQCLTHISLGVPLLTLFNRGYVLWWNVRPDDPIFELELYKFVVVISGILRNRLDESHDARELA